MDIEKLNDNILKFIINEFQGIDNIIKNYNLFFNYINKNKLTNREENGEVLTPINLLDELFNQLENFNKTIYKEKLKWFDTSAGCGLFFIIVYKHLIKYHSKKEILEEMFYFSELNKNNCNYINLIFNNDNKYKLNIYQGDTLTLNIKDYFKIDKFDIIVQNPPFNNGCILKCLKGIKKENTYKSIWQEFINYSFNNLKSNGYFLSINPNTFYKKNRELHNEILEKEIYFIYNYDTFNTKEIFNASIPISIYFLKNSININNTKTLIKNFIKTNIIDEYLIIDKNKSLSPIYQNIFYKLNNFLIKNKCEIEYKTLNTTIINNEPIIYKKNINNLNKNKFYSIYTYTIKDGYILRECKEHKDQNKYKLILKNQRAFIGSLITNEFGICGRRGFYILNDDINYLTTLKNYFDNYKLPYFISILLKYSQAFIDNDIFLYLPDINKLKIKINNEQQLLKLIGLNKTEQNIILNFK